MSMVDAWKREDFDDADDAIAAEFGRGLAEQRERLVFSGSVRDVLLSWSQPSDSDIPAALWNLCDAEAVSQAHALFHDAGADVSVTNTWGCGPRALKKLDVTAPCDRVCNAAVRSARSCSPRFVAGLVGFATAAADGALEDEAYDLSLGLLKSGVHALLLGGIITPQQALKMMRGAHRANTHAGLAPRPVILAVEASSFRANTHEFKTVLHSACEQCDELVGLGLNGVPCDQFEDYLPLVREMAAFGREVYIGFAAEHYRELSLANAANAAVANGVRLLACESGIPLAGTTLLVSALENHE